MLDALFLVLTYSNVVLSYNAGLILAKPNSQQRGLEVTEDRKYPCEPRPVELIKPGGMMFSILLLIGWLHLLFTFTVD